MIVKVRVVPNAKKDEIIEGEIITIRVKAKAEKDKANQRLIKLLEKHYNSKVRIISGIKSRDKVIEVYDKKL